MAHDETVGQRIAKYRRLEGWSAQRLADATGLTRSVIANIENGRRPDITIRELTDVSAALGIPPVAILFPLDRPFAMTSIGGRTVRVADAVDWFAGEYNQFKAGVAGSLAGKLRWYGERLARESSRIAEYRKDIYSALSEIHMDGRQLAAALDEGSSADSDAARELLREMTAASSSDVELARRALERHDSAVDVYTAFTQTFEEIGGESQALTSTAAIWEALEKQGDDGEHQTEA